MSPDLRKQHKSSELIWFQEDFRRYVHGGYHPVSLGDTLHHGRYTILHKLGWGGFAMVWLARDLHKNEWVAIKIIAADLSNNTNEQGILSKFSSSNSSIMEHHSFIIRILDHFSHHGPNGQHTCLVFELLGPSLDRVIEDCREMAKVEEVEYYDFLKPKVILKVARQLLTAIAVLHEAGYVHGDITSKNIAFTTRRISKLANHQFFEILGDPRSENVSRNDGKPLHKGIPMQLVNAVTWSGWCDEEDEDIRLIDFGSAFLQSDSPPKLIHQPSQFQAPESLLMRHLDYRSDLWSVGVVLYSLMFSVPFYWGGDVATALAQMAAFVGGFPPEWQQQFDKLENRDAMEKYYSPTPKIDVELTYNRSRILKPLFPVLRGLLKMRPSDRLNAREALEMISGPKNHKSHKVVKDNPRRQGLRSRDPKPNKT